MENIWIEFGRHTVWMLRKYTEVNHKHVAVDKSKMEAKWLNHATFSEPKVSMQGADQKWHSPPTNYTFNSQLKNYACSMPVHHDSWDVSSGGFWKQMSCYRHGTHMVSVLCEIFCEQLEWNAVWRPSHTGHIYGVFPQCVWVGALWECIMHWMPYHTHYTHLVSLPCDFSDEVSKCLW